MPDGDSRDDGNGHRNTRIAELFIGAAALILTGALAFQAVTTGRVASSLAAMTGTVFGYLAAMLKQADKAG